MPCYWDWPCVPGISIAESNAVNIVIIYCFKYVSSLSLLFYIRFGQKFRGQIKLYLLVCILSPLLTDLFTVIDLFQSKSGAFVLLAQFFANTSNYLVVAGRIQLISDLFFHFEHQKKKFRYFYISLGLIGLFCSGPMAVKAMSMGQPDFISFIGVSANFVYLLCTIVSGWIAIVYLLYLLIDFFSKQKQASNLKFSVASTASVSVSDQQAVNPATGKQEKAKVEEEDHITRGTNLPKIQLSSFSQNRSLTYTVIVIICFDVAIFIIHVLFHFYPPFGMLWDSWIRHLAISIQHIALYPLLLAFHLMSSLKSGSKKAASQRK